jgi:glycine cleavage system H protein
VGDASYPADLLYHPEHDWARVEGDQATLGITWYAQDVLGEVVFFEPPAVGTKLTQGEAYAEVESVKAVADVIAPLTGEIVAVNDQLSASPQAINEDPYGQGWLVTIRLDDSSGAESLMDAERYTASLTGARDQT